MNNSTPKTNKSDSYLGIIAGLVWAMVGATLICFLLALFLMPKIVPAAQPPTPAIPSATFTIPPAVATPTLLITAAPPAATPTNVSSIKAAQITPLNASQVTEVADLGKGVIGQVAFSPDGNQIAVASSTGVQIYDAKLLQVISQFAGDDWIASLAYSPDGKTLATWYPNGSVALWDVSTAQRLQTLTSDSSGSYQFRGGGVFEVAFSPDGKILAAGQGDGAVHLWDPASGQLIRTIKGSKTSIHSVAISPDGKFLASTATFEGIVRVWSVESGELVKELKVAGIPIMLNVNFSPDGNLLAVSGAILISIQAKTAESSVTLWDTTSWQEARQIKAQDGGVVGGVAFSPDGKTLTFSAGKGGLSFWEIATGAQVRALEGPAGRVYSVAFSPDGQTLVSGSTDGLSLWDTVSGAALKSTSAYGEGLTDIALSSNGISLVTASKNGEVVLWDASTRQRTRAFNSAEQTPKCVAVSPNGRLISSGFEDGSIRIWDAESGAEIRTLNGHTSDVVDIAFSPDNTLLASASDDKTIILWSVADGQKQHTLSGKNEGKIVNISFSSDGTQLLSSSSEGEIKLWDVFAGNAIYVLAEFPFDNRSVFSPDGKVFASADLIAIKIWNAANGQQIHEWSTERAEMLAFSPDGRILVSGGSDGSLNLWNVNDDANLLAIATLKVHHDSVTGIVFTPDGKTMITSSLDGTVRFWNVVQQ